MQENEQPSWKDISTYSRDTKQQDRVPHTFEFKGDRIRASIVRNHIYNPGFWTMHCADLNISTMSLRIPSQSDESIDQAKEACLATLRHEVRRMCKDLGLVVEPSKENGNG